ncbi:MAG: phosphotransferase [Thermoplasmata archaeon]|nr:phosphotransferase [Thermoplasmata archaeon]
MSAVVGALRPIVPPDLFEHLRKTYAIGGIELTMDLGGSRNLNLMITTGAGMLVVRAYRNGMSLDRLKAIQAARKALNAKGVPAPQVLQTRQGESWSRHEGHLIELEEYVEHNSRLDSWGSLESGLPVLGRVHTILSTLNVSPAGAKAPVSNYLGFAELQEWTPRAMKRVQSWSLGEENLRLLGTAETLAVRLYNSDRAVKGRPSVQLVHGNFWGANVLLRNGKVVLVTDLDFMGTQPRIEDLALTLYYANSTLSQDSLSDTSILRLAGLVNAYDHQLEVHLTSDERSALPLAIARAPLATMRYIALSETAEEARHLVVGMRRDVGWATAVIDDLARWQRGFA